jgi:rhodanese-related sulfurtransferase
MKKGFKAFVAEANAAIQTRTVAQASALVGNDEYLFVDVRDQHELEKDGQIPGAVNVSRGMLEFCLDPESPYHNEALSAGKKLIFYCASGGRSALSAARALEMGVEDVSHVGGGLKEWKEQGGPLES